MKNKGKTEAVNENTDDSIWNFELEWPDLEIKWVLTEIEWPEIDMNWSTDIDLWETKKNSEDNVKGVG